jgi:hypothetical protein
MHFSSHKFNKTIAQVPINNFSLFSTGLAIVLQNNQPEQEIYVIFGIVLYKYNNIIDKYLLGKNA